MHVSEILVALRNRWLYVLVPFLLGTLAMGTWSYLTPDSYRSTATVFFSLQVGSDINAGQLYQGSNFTQNLLASYAELASKQVVLQPVVDELGFDMTVGQLSSKITTVTSPDTVLIDIVVTDGSADRAALIANSVATHLSDTVHDLSTAGQSSSIAVNGYTVQEAVAASFPSAPRTRNDLIIGGLAGLLLGLALAIGRERFDTRVRTERDLPAGESILGAIPFDAATKDVVIAQGPGREIQAESLRRIRTNLQFVDVDTPSRVVVVTSSVEGEGKTSVSINLAAVFADAGLDVLLVDADLRRPRASTVMDLEGSVGLTNVLAGQADLDDALQTWGSPAISVLPSGSVPPNPSELLGSSQMADLMTRLRGRFDFVVIDTPPLLPVTDPAVVSAYSDGIMVVARAGKVKRHQLAEATQMLHQLEVRVLGVVLNMVNPKAFGRRYQQYAPIKQDEGPRS